MHQKPGQPGLAARGQGEALLGNGRDEASLTQANAERLGRASLLEQVLARENLVLAWKRVKANRGSLHKRPGMSGSLLYGTVCSPLHARNHQTISNNEYGASASCL